MRADLVSLRYDAQMIGDGSQLFDEGKRTVAAHRESMRGAALPSARGGTAPTFVHGFLLPFTLIAATLRSRDLRWAYLRLFVVRAILVGLIAIPVFRHQAVKVVPRERDRIVGITHHKAKHEGGHGDDNSVRVDLGGFHIDVDDKKGDVTVVAPNSEHKISVSDDAAAPKAPAKPLTRAQRFEKWLEGGWTWLLSLIAVISGVEAVMVFFSRRWDDWLSFHVSGLARIKPEDRTPKTPKLALDLGWLYRKVKRRLRGYIVFASGLPVLALLSLIPGIGSGLFAIATTFWGWYWFGVFAASKSAHAWVDADRAAPPKWLRDLRASVGQKWWSWPVRTYARLWSWLTRGLHAPATTFEQSPAPFLGLALARVILTLPGFYLLARPIVPVAAGRLCAELDPANRFSA